MMNNNKLMSNGIFIAVKNILILLGLHLVLSAVPLLFVTILAGDPQYTVRQPKSGTEVVIYFLYLVLFVVAYFLMGRKSGGSQKYKRMSASNISAVVFSGAVIATVGILVYRLIIMAQSKEIFYIFFAMPQFMVVRAIGEDFIRNKVGCHIVMVAPFILLLAGWASNGLNKSKKGKAVKKKSVKNVKSKEEKSNIKEKPEA